MPRSPSSKLTSVEKGRERAKAVGVYRGRKPSVDVRAVRELRAKGVGATEIAKKVGIGRASVYHALKV